MNPLDIAPPYAGILMAISTMVAAIPGIVSPILTGVIVQNQVSHGSGGLKGGRGLGGCGGNGGRGNVEVGFNKTKCL